MRCNCGYRGCLETMVAAPAVLRRATAAGRSGESVLLRELLMGRDLLTIEDLARAAREGDEVANSLLIEAGGHVGTVLDGLVNVLNPERILVGGVFTAVGPLLLASIR